MRRLILATLMIIGIVSMPVMAKASCSGTNNQTTCTNRTFVAAVMIHIINTTNSTRLDCTSSRGSTWCNDGQGQRYSSTSSSGTTFISGPDGYSGRQNLSGGSILGSDNMGASWRSLVNGDATFGSDGGGNAWQANTSKGSTFIRDRDGVMIASCTTSVASIFCRRRTE